MFQFQYATLHSEGEYILGFSIHSKSAAEAIGSHAETAMRPATMQANCARLILRVRRAASCAHRHEKREQVFFGWMRQRTVRCKAAIVNQLFVCALCEFAVQPFVKLHGPVRRRLALAADARQVMDSAARRH